MKKLLLTVTAVLLAAPLSLKAQAPAGSTGQCKDGSYTSVASKSGACRGHKGVQTWYAATPAASAGAASKAVPAAAAKPVAPAPAVAPAAKPVAAAAAAPAAKPVAAAPAAAPVPKPAPAAKGSTAKQPAPGGGPGMVWVNTASKVYHCPGGESYGTTKEGKYMSEADAKASGAHAARNKPCSAR